MKSINIIYSLILSSLQLQSADLVILGFDFDSSKAEDFEIYNGLGDMMFVYASQPKLIQ